MKIRIDEQTLHARYKKIIFNKDGIFLIDGRSKKKISSCPCRYSFTVSKEEVMKNARPFLGYVTFEIKGDTINIVDW